MRLTQQTKNAVSILVHLARTPGRSPTVPEIAQACGITENNTFKLVPVLVRAGFLNTIRGRNGGVILARPADEIPVGEVVRATEGSLQSAGEQAASDTMTFEAMVDDAFLAFVEILDRSTIAELAGAGDADQPRPETRIPPRQTTGAG